MATQTPIAQMGLMEARRSLLMQSAGIRALEDKIKDLVYLDSESNPVGITTVTDDEVIRLTSDLLVKHDNIMLTAEHIAELEAKA